MAEKKEMQAKETRRAVYLIPNTFTALALLAGFYAVLKAVEGEYQVAGWAILIAAIMDLLDGRIARLIKAESDFGAQFDSLSDVICFGLVPAVLAHQWGLVELGRLGFAVGFFYTAAAAVRLARFNVSHGSEDPRYFVGLPSPVAGVTIASAVQVAGAEPTVGVIFVLMLLMLFTAASMVSDFRYFAFKDINLRGRIDTTMKLLFSLAVISLFALFMLEYRASGILFLCLAYLASGYILSGKKFWLKLKKDHISKVRGYFDGVKKRLKDRKSDVDS